MNNIRQNLKSKKYYSSITGLDFIPREHLEVGKPKFKKGEVISCKKFLFAKPRIKYAETDLYEKVYHDYDGNLCKIQYSPNKYASSMGARYCQETGEFYKEARVVVRFEGDTETIYFTYDKDALDFIKDLKEKCKKCGNELL